MKKYFLSMMSIMMMAVLSVNLMSCSKDDDVKKSETENGVNGGGKSSLFVGNWLEEESASGYHFQRLFVFKDDGTFIAQTMEEETGHATRRTTLKGTYTYSPATGVITLRITSSNDSEVSVGAVWTYTLVSSSSSAIVLGYDDDGDYFEDTYEKTDKTSLFSGDGGTSTPFIGNWLEEESASGYHFQRLFVFKDDGTFIAQTKEEETGHATISMTFMGTYTYSPTTGIITLRITSSNDSEVSVGSVWTYTLVSSSSSAIVLGYDDDGDYFEDTYYKTTKNSL